MYFYRNQVENQIYNTVWTLGCISKMQLKNLLKIKRDEKVERAIQRLKTSGDIKVNEDVITALNTKKESKNMLICIDVLCSLENVESYERMAEPFQIAAKTKDKVIYITSILKGEETLTQDLIKKSGIKENVIIGLESEDQMFDLDIQENYKYSTVNPIKFYDKMYF